MSRAAFRIDALVDALNDPGKFGPELRSLAVEQGVATLLANSVRETDPVWSAEVLKQSWAAHERSLWNLREVLRLLAAAGVSALCLKGPLLALRHYSPACLRKPSWDIDLVVRERDLARACAALEAEGYRPASTLSEAKRASHHVVFDHASRCTVELHFRLSHGPAGIPAADFFPRAIPFTMPGGWETAILSPADELMHLVLHLVHDRFGLLFHFVELRRIWRAAPLAVREQAISRGVASGFSGAFMLADAAFRSRWKEPLLPDTVALPGTWLGWRLNEDYYRNWETRTELSPFAERLRGRWFDLQSSGSPRQALRMIESALRCGWL